MALSKSSLREKAWQRAHDDALAGRTALEWEQFAEFMFGSAEWTCYLETYKNFRPRGPEKTWREKEAERLNLAAETAAQKFEG